VIEGGDQQASEEDALQREIPPKGERTTVGKIGENKGSYRADPGVKRNRGEGSVQFIVREEKAATGRNAGRLLLKERRV